jgi:molecular chaperone GrpE
MSQTDPAKGPDAPEGAAPADNELAGLARQLEETTAKLRIVSKAFQDQQQEMKAFRDRFESAAKSRHERQALELVRAFFDPVQNLRRSLDANVTDAKQLVEGLELVHHQFHEALVKLGLEEAPGVGAPFDPSLHEAIGAVEVSDPALDGKVAVVYSDGWHVRGQVLQTARVAVGRLVQQIAEPEAAGEA